MVSAEEQLVQDLGINNAGARQLLEMARNKGTITDDSTTEDQVKAGKELQQEFRNQMTEELATPPRRCRCLTSCVGEAVGEMIGEALSTLCCCLIGAATSAGSK